MWNTTGIEKGIANSILIKVNQIGNDRDYSCGKYG
jgi:enolase